MLKNNQKTEMRFKKIISLLISYLLLLLPSFVVLAESKSHNNDLTTVNSKFSEKQINTQQIKDLENTLLEVNSRLSKIENRLAKESKISNLEDQIINLQKSANADQEKSLNWTSILLNICIVLTGVFITGLTIVLGVLAFFGFKSLSNIREGVSEDVTSKVTKLVTRKVTDKLDSKTLEKVKSIFSNEASKIYKKIDENINEIQEKVDDLNLKVIQSIDKAVVAEEVKPAEEPESVELQQEPIDNSKDVKSVKPTTVFDKK